MRPCWANMGPKVAQRGPRGGRRGQRRSKKAKEEAKDEAKEASMAAKGGYGGQLGGKRRLRRPTWVILVPRRERDTFRTAAEAGPLNIDF